MKTFFLNTILFAATVCVLASCDDACVAERQIPVRNAVWHKDTVVVVTLPIVDTVSAGNAILLAFRNNDDYPYNNIILSVTAKSPSGAAFCDTVEYRLTDAQEVWLGKKSGKWYDQRLAFRSDVQFLQSGNYEFSISHLMRDEDLRGVGAVGVRIERMYDPQNDNR